MQAIAIPGYRGHIAGKVSENLHGGTFGSENHLATQSLPLRSMRRTWSEPFRAANHDPALGTGKGLEVPSRIPGYAGTIPGKLSETVHGMRFAEASESAQALRTHNPQVTSDGWLKRGVWPVDRMHTYQWNNRFVQTGGQALFSPAQDLESLDQVAQGASDLVRVTMPAGFPRRLIAMFHAPSPPTAGGWRQPGHPPPSPWPGHAGPGGADAWDRRFAPRPPPSWKAHHHHHHQDGGLPYGDPTSHYNVDAEVGHKLREAMQEAAVQYGRQALHTGANLAKKAAIAIYVHAEASAWTVKGIAFTVAVAMFVVSLLSIFNVFYAMAHPLYYVLATYDVFFALIIVIMEGPSEMQCQHCGLWNKLQHGLFGWAAFLASRTGRALFYFFVGTLNMFMMPHDWLWTMIYFGLGAGLSFVGLLSLLDRYGCTRICCPGMRNHVSGDLHEMDFGRGCPAVLRIPSDHAQANYPHYPNYPGRLLSRCAEAISICKKACDTLIGGDGAKEMIWHGAADSVMMSKKMGTTFGLHPPQPNPHKPGDRYIHSKFEKKKEARLDPSKVPAAGASPTENFYKQRVPRACACVREDL
ncbi:unnamed protein product [Symbiodinium sp. KB8]|nr:unnamed protein product [Symbiodinium sp. KB8]